MLASQRVKQILFRFKRIEYFVPLCIFLIVLYISYKYSSLPIWQQTSTWEGLENQPRIFIDRSAEGNKYQNIMRLPSSRPQSLPLSEQNKNQNFLPPPSFRRPTTVGPPSFSLSGINKNQNFRTPPPPSSRPYNFFGFGKNQNLQKKIDKKAKKDSVSFFQKLFPPPADPKSIPSEANRKLGTNGTNKESFSNYRLEGTSLSDTEVDLNKWQMPSHEESRIRQPAPLDQPEMDMFANTEFKPECCPNTFSTSMGCACMSMEQWKSLRQRGGNNVPDSGW